jgi:hypothetical protein
MLFKELEAPAELVILKVGATRIAGTKDVAGPPTLPVVPIEYSA